MEANTHSSEDPIIYFTLIDFLLQLLFFGLFLFAIVRFGSNEIPVPMKPSEKDAYDELAPLRPRLPFYKGMSELVDADSQQQMLDALRRLQREGLLEDFLRFATDDDAPLDSIRVCEADPELCRQIFQKCRDDPASCKRFASKRDALGQTPCREKGEPLFKVIVRGSGRAGEEGGFVVRELFPAGVKDLGDKGIHLTPGQAIDKKDFVTLFAPVSRQALDCAHYVEYVMETDSNAMWEILRKPFYTKPVAK